MAKEVRGKKPGKGWLVAESIVLSLGIFSTLVMASFALGSPSLPFYSTTVLPIFILTVPAVALLVYAQRNRASGIALVGASLLSSYAWLQFVIVPIGFGWGFIRLMVLMLALAGSVDWILKSPKAKFGVRSQGDKYSAEQSPQADK